MNVYELYVNPLDLLIATYRGPGGIPTEHVALFVRYVSAPTAEGGRGVGVELVWDPDRLHPTAPYFASQSRLLRVTIPVPDLLHLRPYAQPPPA